MPPTEPTQAPSYLTVAEAADILRLKPYRVAQLCRDKKIPATNLTGRWLIPEDELRASLEASRNDQDVA